MKILQMLSNRIHGKQRPKAGRMIVPRAEDSIRDYPGSGLTPSRLAAILREADDGTLDAAMQLFEEMEEKDAHLYCVANTRRLALTGLPWQVVSAADLHKGLDAPLADQAASYCDEILHQLDSFEEALQHLSLAIGRNIAISEIVWDVVGGELQPVELSPVDFTRITFDDSDRARILTADQPQDGIELPPHKFIIHTPHSASGHPQRGGLLRVSAMVYLAKNLSLKDWLFMRKFSACPPASPATNHRPPPRKNANCCTCSNRWAATPLGSSAARWSCR